MRIHYIQHVPFEEIGYLQDWLLTNGVTVSATKVWEDANFPSTDEFDGLIVMGGPMGMYEEDKYSFLAAEKEFIAKAIGENKKVLGICLGSQLIAAALGAKVYTNAQKEIGWFPINIDAGFGHWLQIPYPAMITAFHWHGDTFDMPAGCINHASSVACSHQLFTYGDHVVGIQFHPEATSHTVGNMIEHCSDELKEARYVQTAEEIWVQSSVNAFGESHEFLDSILGKLFLSVREGLPRMHE